jgi:hypothetical protein
MVITEGPNWLACIILNGFVPECINLLVSVSRHTMKRFPIIINQVKKFACLEVGWSDVVTINKIPFM